MAKMARTWWGEKFLEVLEISIDPGRLKRGRAYAGPNRLLKFEIRDDNAVAAVVRGNVNPYFGVYEEPRYKATIKLKQFSQNDWTEIVDRISRNAACLSQLLMNEMPSTIESVFTARGMHLLPRDRSDLTGKCSCPDYSSLMYPCKHVAGVYYKVASLLDRDPMLLFQLRGMRFDTMVGQLSETPLGRALVARQSTSDEKTEYHAHRYAPPKKEPREPADLKTFWLGAGRLPDDVPIASAIAPAILIKRGGEHPAFWHRDNSFIEAMEDVYTRIVDKNKTSL